MDLTEIAERARFFARATSAAASDGLLLSMMKDAVRQFSKDVFGVPIVERLTVGASFDTTTSFGFNVSITGGTNALASTDVVIAARTAASGTTIASDLASALNTAIATGDLTASFTNFYFSIDSSATAVSTAITFNAPDAETYIDARDLLGLSGSLSGSSGVFTGTFPEDCTMRATLSGTPIAIKRVAWDKALLESAPRGFFVHPQAEGDPSHYYVEGSTIYLNPTPNDQKELYVGYKGIPSLSDMTSLASSTIPSEIPDQYHIALAYWMAAELLLGSFEDNLRAHRLASYQQIVTQYRVNQNNQNAAMEPMASPGRWWKYGG